MLFILFIFGVFNLVDQEAMAAQDKLAQRQPVVDRLMEKDCRECSIHQACSR